MELRETKHEVTFARESIKRINFHLLAGMESILGGGGSKIHLWIEKIIRLDRNYIKKYLCLERPDDFGLDKIIRANDEESLHNHRSWGALDYAGIILQKKSTDRVKSEKPHRQFDRFRKVVRNGEHAKKQIFLAFDVDERLNRAWRKKLKLMKGLENLREESRKFRETEQ